LAGASDGSICLLEDVINKATGRLADMKRRGLRPSTRGVRVSCLAATDEIVVNGFDDGGIQVIRMANPIQTRPPKLIGSDE
jgi:hypothetical protein